MQRYQLRAALAITIDGVAFAEGAVVAEIATAVPLGCVLSAMRIEQLRAEPATPQVIGFAAGAPVSRSEPTPESTDKKPTRRGRRPPPPAALLQLSLDIQAKLAAAGLESLEQIREHFEAFETFADIPELTEEEAAAVIAALG